MDNNTAQQLKNSIDTLNRLMNKFARSNGDSWSGSSDDNEAGATEKSSVGWKQFKKDMKEAASASKILSDRFKNLLPRNPFNKVIQKFEDAGDEIFDATTAIGRKTQKATLDFVKATRATTTQMRKIAEIHHDITIDMGKARKAMNAQQKDAYEKAVKSLDEKIKEYENNGLDASELKKVVSEFKDVAKKIETVQQQMKVEGISEEEMEKLQEELKTLNGKMDRQYHAVQSSETAQRNLLHKLDTSLKSTSEEQTKKLSSAFKAVGAGMAVDIARLGNVIESELRNIRGSEATDHLLAAMTGLSGPMLNQLQQENLRLTTISAEQRAQIMNDPSYGTGVEAEIARNNALRQAGRDSQNELIRRMSTEASRFGYYGQDAQVFMNDMMRTFKESGIAETQLSSGQYASQAISSMIASNAQAFEMSVGDAAKEMSDFASQPAIRALMTGLDDKQRVELLKEESETRHTLLKTLGISVDMQKKINAEQRSKSFSPIVERVRTAVQNRIARNMLQRQGIANFTDEELDASQKLDLGIANQYETGIAEKARGRASHQFQQYSIQSARESASPMGALLGLAPTQIVGQDMLRQEYADAYTGMESNRRLQERAAGMTQFSEDINQVSERIQEQTGIIQQIYQILKPYQSGIQNSVLGGTAAGVLAAGSGLLGGVGSLATEVTAEMATHAMMNRAANGKGRMAGIFQRIMGTPAGPGINGGFAAGAVDAASSSGTATAGRFAGKLGMLKGIAGGLGIGLLGTAATYGGDMLKEAGHEKSGAALDIGGYALAGAGLGSIVPGLGTAIGAGLGASVGAVIGAYQNRDIITDAVESNMKAIGIDPSSTTGNILENVMYGMNPLGWAVGYDKIMENLGFNEPATTVNSAAASAATSGMVLQPDGTYAPATDKTAELVELSREQVELSREHLNLDSEAKLEEAKRQEAQMALQKYTRQAQENRAALIESAYARMLS